MAKGETQDEYSEVGNNIRHWQQMRFTAMTVFIAVTAGLLTAIFQWRENPTSLASISIRLMGILAVIVFWVQDERIVQYWQHFTARAKDLEVELGFEQYSKTPRRNQLITSGNAIRLLYFTFLVFWIATLIFYSQF